MCLYCTKCVMLYVHNIILDTPYWLDIHTDGETRCRLSTLAWNCTFWHVPPLSHRNIWVSVRFHIQSGKAHLSFSSAKVKKVIFRAWIVLCSCAYLYVSVYTYVYTRWVRDNNSIFHKFATRNISITTIALIIAIATYVLLRYIDTSFHRQFMCAATVFI